MPESRLYNRLRGLPASIRQLNYSLQLLSGLRTRGWHRSVSGSTPVDAQGDPLPWFTYPAIDWLSARLKPTDAVFEFGAGYSSLWFSARTQHVIAVEHNSEWAARLEQESPSNLEVLLKEAKNDEIGVPHDRDTSEYVKAILDFPDQHFDVIVIDGMERVTCASVAHQKLAADGILIFDNADRKEYAEGFEYLFRLGFGRIDFSGVVPGYGVTSCTSVFGRFSSRWTQDHDARPVSNT